MRGKIDQRAVFRNGRSCTEQRHESNEHDQEHIDAGACRNGNPYFFHIAVESLDHLRHGHDCRQREGNHSVKREHICRRNQGSRQRRKRRQHGCNEKDSDHADHAEYRYLFTDTDGFHADENDSCRQYVVEDHANTLRHAEPGIKDGSRTCDEAADVHEDGQSYHGKCKPGQVFSCFPLEQFVPEAFDELGSSVVQGKLRDHKMHEQVDEVDERDDPQKILPAVPRSQVGNREDSGSDAVPDDDACRFKK